MSQVFKSPLDQAESINPFNKLKISDERGSVSPSSFFSLENGESKRLVNMSPNDYYKFVSHQIGTTPERLMEHRTKHANLISTDEIQKKMREGTKFDTPWLRLTDRGEVGTTPVYWQEGLHRMLAAGREYGMDTKFPIYIGYENDPWNELDSMNMDDFIKHYDTTRQSRYDKHNADQKAEDERLAALEKEWTAAHFKVPVEQVTPEMIKEYQKWEDSLWTEDVLEDVLKDINKK